MGWSTSTTQVLTDDERYFEAGLAGRWTPVTVPTLGDAHTGSYALVATGTSPSNTFSLRLATSVGQTFTWVGWVKALTSAATVTIKWYDDDLVYLSTGGTFSGGGSGWDQASLGAVAPSGARYVIFSATCPTAYTLKLDEQSIVATSYQTVLTPGYITKGNKFYPMSVGAMPNQVENVGRSK